MTVHFYVSRWGRGYYLRYLDDDVKCLDGSRSELRDDVHGNLGRQQ